MDENEKGLMSLGELPESCISNILSFTTPRDVCRLSTVSQTFRLAGHSDPVWEKLLPIQCHHLLSRLDSPLQFSSKRELYFTLCHPNMIDGRTKLVHGPLLFLLQHFHEAPCSNLAQHCFAALVHSWVPRCLSAFLYQKFWIERVTGKLCFMLSARELDITGGDDNRYWRWISQDDSSFKEIAEVVLLLWIEVRGQFDCKLLSPGVAYTVTFRLKLHDTPHGISPFLPIAYGWDIRPVKFSVTTPCGDHQIYARYLSDTDKPVANQGYQMAALRHVEDGWMEFDAGTFVVEEDGVDPGKIEFCMGEWRGRLWKGGLLLEGVKIQPTSLVNERTI